MSVLLGGFSKVVASTVTYPYQLVKSRLQQREVFSEALNTWKPKYAGTIDCFLQIWRFCYQLFDFFDDVKSGRFTRKDGFLGFFRGAVPNALKVAPSSAITFLVYEECLKILK